MPVSAKTGDQVGRSVNLQTIQVTLSGHEEKSRWTNAEYAAATLETVANRVSAAVNGEVFNVAVPGKKDFWHLDLQVAPGNAEKAVQVARAVDGVESVRVAADASTVSRPKRYDRESGISLPAFANV